jgi:hypothetical protein
MIMMKAILNPPYEKSGHTQRAGLIRSVLEKETP